MSKLTHQASLISYFQYIFSHLIETHPCYRLWWLVKHKKNLPIPSVCTSAYYYINNNPNKSQKNLKESHTVSKIFRASRKESWRILVKSQTCFFFYSKESQKNPKELPCPAIRPIGAVFTQHDNKNQKKNVQQKSNFLGRGNLWMNHIYCFSIRRQLKLSYSGVCNIGLVPCEQLFQQLTVALFSLGNRVNRPK